ncbi:MAG TPA: Mur ligase domain-containing protein, partial [Candidatus Baltobacteraceae bacterium]
MKLPLTDVVAAASAQIRRKEDLPEEAAFSTDTRTLEPGDLFVALRGEHFDGHAFIGEAMAKGAAGAVVDDAAALGEHTPGLIVRQT